MKTREAGEEGKDYKIWQPTESRRYISRHDFIFYLDLGIRAKSSMLDKRETIRGPRI